MRRSHRGRASADLWAHVLVHTDDNGSVIFSGDKSAKDHFETHKLATVWPRTQEKLMGSCYTLFGKMEATGKEI